MSVPVIAFFSTRGGIGKTFLTYHTAWMLADLGYSVVVADLDPQCSLSAARLTEDQFIGLSQKNRPSSTIYGAVSLPSSRLEVEPAFWLAPIATNLSLIPGDLSLIEFERDLARAWYRCQLGDKDALHLLCAFGRVIQQSVNYCAADIVLMDLGPNLGSLNRAALIAADSIAIPVGPDLFSIQALQSLGTGLRSLRQDWSECLARNPNSGGFLPSGQMNPIGYMVMSQSGLQGRMPFSFHAWASRIPAAYAQAVLGEPNAANVGIQSDENCLAVIKYYHGLMSMAKEARKPMFELKPADGALGALSQATLDAYRDFKHLAEKLIQRAGVRERS